MSKTVSIKLPPRAMLETIEDETQVDLTNESERSQQQQIQNQHKQKNGPQQQQMHHLPRVIPPVFEERGVLQSEWNRMHRFCSRVDFKNRIGSFLATYFPCCLRDPCKASFALAFVYSFAIMSLFLLHSVTVCDGWDTRTCGVKWLAIAAVVISFPPWIPILSLWWLLRAERIDHEKITLRCKEAFSCYPSQLRHFMRCHLPESLRSAIHCVVQESFNDDPELGEQKNKKHAKKMTAMTDPTLTSTSAMEEYPIVVASSTTPSKVSNNPVAATTSSPSNSKRLYTV